jgi:outer membrane biosynthesis protein TonB
MPTSTPHRDPKPISNESGVQPGETPFVAAESNEADAPLHVVPPTPQPAGPVRIRTSRYGDLDEHELMRVLDSIEDELAKRRFRESLYISFFLCVALAWVVLYGPRYLWHSPQLVMPSDVMKHRELVELNAPVMPHSVARPAPKVDTKTLEKLRTEAPPPPKAAPAPTQPAPATPPPPAAATPTPAQPAPSPLPSAPAPARSSAPLADAPAPQPTATKPNFGTPTDSNAMSSLLRDSAKNRAGGSGIHDVTRSGKGASEGSGVQVLSDMQGVDFSDYLRRMLSDVKRNWLPLLPEEIEPPISKQGETRVRFTILPDGRIGGMTLEGRSGDVALDKAAWGSIVSEGQFPPLPSQFHGPNLELRIYFMVNKNVQ